MPKRKKFSSRVTKKRKTSRELAQADIDRQQDVSGQIGETRELRTSTVKQSTAKSTNDQSNGYAVQIVDVKKGKLELKENELKKILMQPELKDMKVIVLSIAGIFRSGKSFLLNLLIRYLSEGRSETWMKDQGSTLKGFDWKSGSKRVTTGIWMWSKVFVVTNSNEKCGVVLMDTQGIHDQCTSDQENASVFALSTLLSSVQIYNVQVKFDETKLQFLQLFTNYGFTVKGDSDEKPFQTLLFLIRDWPYPTESKFGFEGGSKHLKTYMEPSPKQSPANQTVRASIYRAFANIMCFLMPSPGTKIVNGTTSGQLKDIDMTFQAQIKKLVENLCLSEVKRIDGIKITCEGFVKYSKFYVDAIVKGGLPKITSLHEAHAIAHDRGCYIEVMKRFEEYIQKLCTTYQNNLEETFRTKKEQALKDFKKKCGTFKSEDYTNLRDEMNDNINSILQKFYSLNNLTEAKANSHNNQLFEGALEIFRTRMNEKSSSYMPASEYETEFKETKRHAMAHFEKEGLKVGPSYSKYYQRLEEDITNMSPFYEDIINKSAAYRAAFEKYTKTMDQKYKDYQEIDAYQPNHDEAKQKALDLYKEKSRGPIYQPEKSNLEEEMNQKGKEYKKKNTESNMIVEKKNNAAHDVALLSYRNEMEKGFRFLYFSLDNMHAHAKREAELMYEVEATRGFPSYKRNKKDLANAMKNVFRDQKKKRRFVFRAFHGVCVYIAGYLLKTNINI